MAIFNSYVKLPEGRCTSLNHMGSLCFFGPTFPDGADRAEIPSPVIRAPCEWLAAHISGSQRPGWSCYNFQKYRMCMKHLYCVFNMYIYIYHTILYIYTYNLCCMKHLISYYTIYLYDTYKCMYVYFKQKRALVLQLLCSASGCQCRGLRGQWLESTKRRRCCTSGCSSGYSWVMSSQD